MDVGASSSHPRRSHGSLRPPRQSKEWSSIGQNRWRNVWITPGRAPSLRSTCQASQTPWLFPLQAHCRPLWRHKTRPITFCLTVDDFGVKHVGKEHADHLIQALNSKHKITTDWEGRLYCGVQLEWNYEAKWVDLSMPNYVKEMRHKFQHDRPSRPEHAPCRWNRPTHGPGPQLPEPEDDSPPLDAKGINEIQQVVGSSLHYGRAIDSTILPALNSISAEQSKATERTRQDAKKLLDYLATHPDAVIRCVKSDMIPHAHGDASHLSAPRNQEASSEGAST